MMESELLREREEKEHYKRTLVKSVRWYDGVILIGFGVPGLLYPSVGSSVVALGALGAAVVWALSAIIGKFQANMVSEVAAMFPEKSGGIGILASEGISRYGKPFGALAAFAYWFGWTIVMAINGVLVGDYIKATIWPSASPELLGTVMLVLLYLFNVYGLKPGVWAGYALGVATVVPMGLMIVGAFFGGSFHWGHLAQVALPNHIGWTSMKGLGVVLTWMFIVGWSAYGTEAAATLAPEYHDTVRDTPKALRGSATISMAFYVLMPLAAVGVLGISQIQKSPYTAFAPMLDKILGPAAGGVVIITVLASLVLSANLATIGGSRTLYQAARDRHILTIFGYVNKRGIPAAGMTLDLIVNVAFIWALKNPIAILVASNVGYFVAWILMLVSFVLLRRDRKDVARPIKLKPAWVGGGVLLIALNTVFLIVGAPSYGAGPLLLGVGVLALSIVMWAVRNYFEEPRRMKRATRVQWDTPDSEINIEDAGAEAS